MPQKEKFIAVPGFPLLRASRSGNVIYISQNGDTRPVFTYKNESGYCLTVLPKRVRVSSKRNYFIHRLVAYTFIPNPQNKPHINHKNGVKSDNRVVNLEWCTPKENYAHAKKIGLQRVRVGKAHSSSIPVVQKLNGSVIAEWPSLNSMRVNSGYHPSAIVRYCLGLQPYAYGFHWELKPSKSKIATRTKHLITNTK